MEVHREVWMLILMLTWDTSVDPFSSLSLLPPQPHLAVGSNDYYMSIYSAEKRLR